MIRGFFLSLFLVGISSAEVTPPTSPQHATPSPLADRPKRLGELIDTLDQGSLQEAFRLLTKDYIHYDLLDSLEVNRAALQGMLTRLDFGAMLLTEKSRSEQNSPFDFHHTPINSEIAYLRFGRYNEAELEKLDTAIREFN